MDVVEPAREAPAPAASGAPVATPDSIVSWASARRAVSVLAVLSLFYGQSRALGAAAYGSVWRTVVVAGGFTVILVLAVAAAVTRDRRTLARVDVATLVVGLAITATQFLGVTSPVFGAGSDESLLNRLAQQLVNHGHNPYGHVFRLIGADGYGTPLLTGGNARTYGYPPLSLEIGRVLGLVWGRLGAPGIVELGALIVLAVTCFVLAPRDWRPVTVVATLGLPIETSEALHGLSLVLGTALVVPALYRWTATGRGGRLGRAGIAQAVFLGLACASHQLLWFAAGFLVIGIHLVRVGELGARRATGVTARYVGVVVATFAVVNAPFVVAGARAWADGMVVTFTQRAIVDGGSWALPLIEANGGSGALTTLSLAAPLALLATAAIFALGIRRLAPAVAVLPGLVFVLAARSNDEYFWALAPVWPVAIAGTDPDAVRRAWSASPASWPGRLCATRSRRVAAAAALWIPALAVFAVGVTTPAPVSVQARGATVRGGSIETITVEVVNHSDRPVRPLFYIDTRSAATHPWTPGRTPAVIAPHSTARVVLRPITALEPNAVAADLWVFSTTWDPAGMSAHPLRLTPRQIVEVDPPRGDSLAARRARCLALRLTGRNYSCTTQLGLTTVSGS